MLFSSITFLYYFLPITLLGYFLVPQKCKNAVLLAASFFFYFWGEPRYCILMAAEVLIGYAGGILIARFSKNRKIITGSSIGAIVLLLIIFKYADFFITGINQAAMGIGNREILPLLKLALPMGISFYSFQIISYLADVAKKTEEPERNLIDFAAYVVMFPQLVAGPIVRYQTIREQMKKRSISQEQVTSGMLRFLCGLAKKVLIADLLGELVAALDGVTAMPLWGYWILAIAYTLQIYYDFSGYSDMAIGLGCVLGFSFPENFDYPYISTSITEFWRRWHMTLGGWFRDYVYIPLGGNRVPKWRWALNVMVVWSLSGLWHGASWNFVVWGTGFGVFLLLEKLWLHKLLDKLPKLAGHMYTLFVVVCSFVIFRADTLKLAVDTFAHMFGIVSLGTAAQTVGNRDWNLGSYQITSNILLLLIAGIGATPAAKHVAQRVTQISIVKTTRWLWLPLGAVGLLLLITAFLISSSAHPFLYFRF